MEQYIKGGLMTCLMATSLFALSDGVATTAIKTAGEVAKEAINKHKSEATITASKIINKTEIDQGAALGNSGISVKADKVKIQNSTLKNNTRIHQGIAVGNSGIDIGK